MGKVLNVLEKTSQAGRQYFVITAEGLDKQIISYNKLAVGYDIDPANLELNGDSFRFKKATDGKTWQDRKANGGSSFVKNDEIIVAQVAFKATVDLVVHDKLDMFDAKGVYREKIITDICTGMAKTMFAVAAALKPAPKTEKTEQAG